MINTEKSESTAQNTPQPRRGLDLSPTQVIAGGGAAAVASVIGGQLGLGGTVVGAFILSVISAVAVPLIRASLERSHKQLQRVVPRRGPNATRSTLPKVAEPPSIIRATSSKVSAHPLPVNEDEEAPIPQQKYFTARKVWMALGGTAAIFVVGLGSVIGVQAATGTPLSNGTGALQTGISQVASNTTNTRDAPGPGPQPSNPAVGPTSAPTDEPTSPAPQETVAPVPTSTPSPDRTAPGGKDTPLPSTAPTHAAGTAAPGSTGNGADGQSAPAPKAATPGPAAK
ncbi:hypothetical protein [Arthrobacter sp. efr-133-TYG-104]|uniref:hypothetical protein n=1 Tax=Arthrobacter sp. efr-133-TYG-104 TaxID=3040324 RepID=UPI00254F83F6|nr:hypothetical protein [Arthrobacter sp. efr-133-TYG-104]